MKSASLSAHCRKSLVTARRVSFFSTVSRFGTPFSEMHLMPKSSVRIDYCTIPNETPNSLESSLLIISWFLLVGGLPEYSSLLTDICLSLNCLNHSLSCVLTQTSFWQNFDANVLLSLLGHHQCSTHDTHNNRFSLTASY